MPRLKKENLPPGSLSITLRPLAQEDLRAAAHYLHAEAGGRIAERFIDAISKATHQIGNAPGIGAPCDLSHPQLQGLRRLPISGFENWLVFYRVKPNAIDVIRVLHGAREIERILHEKES